MNEIGDKRAMREIAEIPVACTLGVEDQAARRGEIARLFEGRQVRELADGYAVRFSGDDDTAAELLRFVTGERACCPFFTFELAFETRQGPIWLSLRGPDGTKVVVAELLGLAL